MVGKCLICKKEALCYRDKKERVYKFFCENDDCDKHWPESESKKLSDIPEWFCWFGDRNVIESHEE